VAGLGNKPPAGAVFVPGIDFTNDPPLQGRNFSYLDTQLKRLGSAFRFWERGGGTSGTPMGAQTGKGREPGA
jgi:hypothetical protein